MLLVTGGTGNIGHELVQLLAASGARVRVLTRDVDKARAALPAEVELVAGSFEHGLEAALDGVERAFLLAHAGPALATTADAFARAARAAGVQQIVAISSGTIEMTPAVKIGTWHRELEDAVTASGVPATFLRPDNFASNSLRWAPMIRARGAVFAPRIDSQSVPIDPHDIAAVAHVALTQPGHAGKIYTLSGPHAMSTREQVAAIANELARPLQVIEVPTDRARAGMIDSGLPTAMADAIIELFGHSPPRPTTTVRDVTGREPRTFAAWVHAHRDAFVGG